MGCCNSGSADDSAAEQLEMQQGTGKQIKKNAVASDSSLEKKTASHKRQKSDTVKTDEYKSNVNNARNMWEQRASVVAETRKEEKRRSQSKSKQKDNSQLKTRRKLDVQHQRQRSHSAGSVPTFAQLNMTKKQTQPVAYTAQHKSNTKAQKERAPHMKVTLTSSAAPIGGVQRGGAGGDSTTAIPLHSAMSIHDMTKRTLNTIGGGDRIDTLRSMDSGLSVGSEQVVDDALTPTHSTEPQVSFADRMGAFRQSIVETDMKQRSRAKSFQADYRRDDKEYDQKTKKRASVLLRNYVDKKKLGAREKAVVDDVMKDVTKENAVDVLRKLHIITDLFVEKDEFKRYKMRTTTHAKIVRLGSVEPHGVGGVDGELEATELEGSDDPNKVRMAVITLTNSSIMQSLMEHQQEMFKSCILWAIEMCPLIYRLNFTNSDIKNDFLADIVGTLFSRYEKIKTSPGMYDLMEIGFGDGHGENSVALYGPEEIHLESNPISDKGIVGTLSIISQNPRHLRIIRLGHALGGTISTKSCGVICDAMVDNTHLLKCTVDLRYKQHKDLLDKVLNRNGDKYRKLRNAHFAKLKQVEEKTD